MAATNPNTTKTHPDPPPLAEIVWWVKEGRAVLSKSGSLKAPLSTFASAIDPGLVSIHQQGIGSYARLYTESKRGTEAAVQVQVDHRAKSLMPSPANAADRGAIAAEERERFSAGFRSQVARELKDQARAACTKASEAGEAAQAAIEQAERALDMPPSLRGGSVALQTLGLMQIADMRTHAAGALPSALLTQWAALTTPEQRELFSYAVGNAVLDMIAAGPLGMKLRFPNLQVERASREFHCALELAAKFDEAKAQRTPEWLIAARAAMDLLTRAFRSACGLDVRWLSNADFAKLYMSGGDPHDPPTNPFKLAKPEQVVTRFLPRSPAAWSGLPGAVKVTP